MRKHSRFFCCGRPVWFLLPLSFCGSFSQKPLSWVARLALCSPFWNGRCYICFCPFYSGFFVIFSLVTVSFPHRLFFKHVLYHYLIFTHHKALHFPSVPFFFFSPQQHLSLTLRCIVSLLSIHNSSSYSFWVHSCCSLISQLGSDFCHVMQLLFSSLSSEHALASCSPCAAGLKLSCSFVHLPCTWLTATPSIQTELIIHEQIASAQKRAPIHTVFI